MCLFGHTKHTREAFRRDVTLETGNRGSKRPRPGFLLASRIECPQRCLSFASHDGASRRTNTGYGFTHMNISIVIVLGSHLVGAAYSQTNDDPPAEEALTLEIATAPSDAVMGAEGAGNGFWDRATENLRFNVDLISRVETTRRRGKAAGLHAVGLDIHKVFSDSSGDIGTMILQPYLTRLDNAFPVPHDAEDDDDWDLVFHTFSFNFTRWGRGATNFKIGHFYIPYGLQPNVDTHLKVRQLISHDNIGADMDWGFSLNGTSRDLEYEVALTQGSGHELIGEGKNFVIAGRLGTPSDRNVSVGVSGMHGQILSPHGLHRWRSSLESPSRVDRVLGRTTGEGRGDDDLVRRTRVGIDATWIAQQYTFRGEASAGRDFHQDVFNVLLEAMWSNPDESQTIYLQAIYLGQRSAFGWDEDVIARLGGVSKFAKSWSASWQYSQDLTTYGSRSEDAIFTVQLQYRF